MACGRYFYPLIVGVLSSACSLHPLPSSDNGEVPVFNIVHRIQCEAADAVKQMHVDRGFTFRSKAVDEILKIIDGKKEELAKLQKVLGQSDFGTRKEELEDAGRSLKLRGAQIDLALEKVVASSHSEKEAELAKNALTIEKSMVEEQARNWNSSYKALLAIADKQEEISKEQKKLKPYDDVIGFEVHAVVFQFELEVTEDNNLSSTGSVSWPAVMNGFAGSITLGYDVGDKRQRLAKRTVKLASTFDELLASFDVPDPKKPNKLNCLDVTPALPDRRPRRYPINGNVGLAEVFADYMKMLRSGKFKTGGESYTDKIQFTTTINGALKPGIDIARKPGPTVKVSADLNGSRKDLHIVTVALSPGDVDGDKGGAVQNLVITSMPAVRIRGDIIRLPPLN